MKYRKKVLAVLSAAAIAASLSVPAFAAEVVTTPVQQAAMTLSPDYVPERFTGIVSRDDIGADGIVPMYPEESTCRIPYNSGSGTSGSVAVSFVADTNHVEFTLDCKYDGSYHIMLYQVNGNGIPDTQVESLVICSFGQGPQYDELVIGATYYFVISSMDVPKEGATGDYSLTTT